MAQESLTGYRIKALAHTLAEYAPRKRIFLILDCCFAGEAVREFQAGNLGDVVEKKTYDVFPALGTSLLVASSKDEPAISPVDKPFTMFSESFIEVLEQGIAGKSEKLSLMELGEEVQIRIRSKFGQRAVRPEIHSPRQRGGDAARLPFFPNPSYVHIQKELPKAIMASLAIDIPDIRIGAIKLLGKFLKGIDLEMVELAESKLQEIIENDDSSSVREYAREIITGTERAAKEQAEAEGLAKEQTAAEQLAKEQAEVTQKALEHAEAEIEESLSTMEKTTVSQPQTAVVEIVTGPEKGKKSNW